MCEATANELNAEQHEHELALDAAVHGPQDVPGLVDDDDNEESDNNEGSDNGDVDDADADAHAIVTATWTENDVSEVRHALSKVRTYSWAWCML